jgi:hypothetical protein
MCGHCASFLPAEAVAGLFHTVNPIPNFPPTWNMAPPEGAMVVRHHPETGDASGGSAFGILRQSIVERQPCLLAGSPDVFSGLKIFWHIQAAARQADHTGARPLGEQRSPADCAEASNKNWGGVATTQRTGHRNSIQGH